MQNINAGGATKKIVIIGGGFAGINLAKKLAGNMNYQVILADRNNYNFFPPLIYQVATGFLEPSSISYPFRKLFRKKQNIHFYLGEFIRVDTALHTCYFNNGLLTYDYLVFAAGATSNYFGNANIKRNAVVMKTLNDALNMRNILLETLELACRTVDPKEKTSLLTIVVAGGGPTGVEVAGMLAELRKYIIAKDYPELKRAKNDIYLVDGGPELLLQMSSRSRKESYEALVNIGVKIKLKTMVADYAGGV